jgi:4-hydroxy-4-methyl-2-oxoglutarate aldolase
LAFRLSGDAGVGQYEPIDIREVAFQRVATRLLSGLKGLTGISSTASDVLDELGWRLSIAGSVIQPRHLGTRTVIGHALTIKYLPERRHLLHLGHGDSPPKLAHHAVFRLARVGDVVVVDAAGCGAISVMGGLAAATARSSRMGGLIIDGAIRDLQDIRTLGLPVWSRYVTPVTGKHRLEATAINSPIQCGGVQVRPGDLVIADDSGICFIPTDLIPTVLARVAEVANEEKLAMPARRGNTRALAIARNGNATKSIDDAI